MHFLALAEYGGGSQKGYLVILRGREGKGWGGFACKAMLFFSSNGLLVSYLSLTKWKGCFGHPLLWAWALRWPNL